MAKSKSSKQINTKTVNHSPQNIPATEAYSLIKFDKDGFIFWPILLAIVCITFDQSVLESALTPRYFWHILACLVGCIFLIFAKKAILFIFDKITNFAIISLIALALWSFLGTSQAVFWQAGFNENLRFVFNAILFVVLLIFLFYYKNLPDQFFKVFIILGIVTAYFGLREFYGNPVAGLPRVTDIKIRPIGVHGNRNLMGSFTMLMLMFNVYACLHFKGIWRIISILALVLTTFILVDALTRTSWISTFAGLGAFFVLILVFYRSSIKSALVYIISFGLLFFIAFPISINLQTDYELSKQLKEKANTFYPFYEIEVIPTPFAEEAPQDNLSGRGLIWRSTLEVVKQKSLIGVGQNHWPIHVLDKPQPENPWYFGYVVPDRPHNVFLEIASEAGLIGLLFYISFFVFVLIGFYKAIFKQESNKLLLITCLAGIVAYSVDSLASFPNERLEHSLVLFIFSSIIFSQNFDREIIVNSSKKYNLVISIFCILFLGYNLFFNYQRLISERHYAAAKNLKDQKRFLESENELTLANNFYFPIDQNTTPHENLSLVNNLELKNIPMAKQRFFEGIKKNPNNAMLYSNMGAVYMNEQNIDSAKLMYNESFRVAPKFRQAVAAMASYNSSIGKHKEALDYLVKLDTTFLDYQALSFVYDNALVNYYNTGKYDSVNIIANTKMFWKYRNSAKALEVMELTRKAKK